MNDVSYLRVAIAGAGRMALHHAQAIRRLAPQTRVAAIADPDPEARTRLLRIWTDAEAYDTLDTLLAKQTVDVVNVCTPPSTHEPLACTALEAGCHVYVEKPFAETVAGAERVVRLAESRGLKVCAGHQQLFETPTRQTLEFLPALGKLVHIESYSSFRPLGSQDEGRPAPPLDLQLLDMLPHPVYLLLAFLEAARPEEPTLLEAVELGERGTLHATVSRGDLRGVLILTPAGRPVENYLRLVGSNGSVQADFVRSTVQRLIGRGESSIDKVLHPYRLAGQLVLSTTKSMVGRLVRRERSYPGLREILDAFYESLRTGSEPPLQPASIVETVQLCELIAGVVGRPEKEPELKPSDEPRQPVVVVTGATGFLGSETARKLLERGASVRAIARRMPVSWQRLDGAEYLTLDLAGPLKPEEFRGADVLIHCAAETAGGWEAHQRNSLGATENVMRAAAAAGIRRVVHVSSLSVLDAKSGREPVSEEAPLVQDTKSMGPYVWGKAESERLARQLAEELRLELKVIRPGALVDYREFQPPGLLGRRLGNLFLAIGSRKETLPVVDVTLCAEILAWLAYDFSEAPENINVMEPDPPTKGVLIERLRQSNPDLRVAWLPRFLFTPLSWLFILTQKVRKPSSPVVNPARIFAHVDYDSSHVESLLHRIRLEP